MRGDQKILSSPVFVNRGILIRLTGALDKDKVFVNGAIGVVDTVFNQDAKNTAFTLRLPDDTLLLVHAIDAEGRICLPCVLDMQQR